MPNPRSSKCRVTIGAILPLMIYLYMVEPNSKSTPAFLSLVEYQRQQPNWTPILKLLPNGLLKCSTMPVTMTTCTLFKICFYSSFSMSYINFEPICATCAVSSSIPPDVSKLAILYRMLLIVIFAHFNVPMYCFSFKKPGAISISSVKLRQLDKLDASLLSLNPSSPLLSLHQVSSLFHPP